MSDMDLESPDADAAEQEQDAFPDAAEDDSPSETPLEANQADAAEQARELGADDDEYR
jgi:hypothetical protein